MSLRTQKLSTKTGSAVESQTSRYRVCVHLSAVHVLAIFGDLVVTLVMLEIVLFILSVSFVLLLLE